MTFRDELQVIGIGGVSVIGDLCDEEIVFVVKKKLSDENALALAGELCSDQICLRFVGVTVGQPIFFFLKNGDIEAGKILVAFGVVFRIA